MEKYRISNHLIFALVMQDKEICKKLLERIFNGKTVKELVLKSEINLDEYEATIEKTCKMQLGKDSRTAKRIIQIC